MKEADVLLAIDCFDQALGRLENALQRIQDDLDRDGALQRFEFTVELAWKTLRIALAYQGIECLSPRGCIKAAFRHGLIDDADLLLDMIEDRNRSSHVYNDRIADAVFERVKALYANRLRRLVEELKAGWRE